MARVSSDGDECSLRLHSTDVEYVAEILGRRQFAFPFQLQLKAGYILTLLIVIHYLPR